MIEIITRLIWRTRSAKLIVAKLLPSGVTHLAIRKPEDFKHKAGDYVYLNIPMISKTEWHPFTISSAPEQEG